MRAGIAVCLWLAATGAAAADAAPLARVVALQPPVWVERDGARRALAAGEPLYAGDRYDTGAGARLQIGLADASTIKLGEQARFALPALQTVDGDDGSLKGSLKVLKGAFRFTTAALGKLRRRELDVEIGPTVTIGIRGTDIWGKSDAQRDLVCLIEGTIEVASPGQPSQRMDQPLTYYYVPRGGVPPPVAPAPVADLERWVPQTELAGALPALHEDGRYRVALVSYAERARAEGKAQALSAEGYAATLETYRHQGAQRHRLVVHGLRSVADAEQFADAMKARLQLPYPWVMSPR